jgi:hypothetical protein
MKIIWSHRDVTVTVVVSGAVVLTSLLALLVLRL